MDIPTEPTERAPDPEPSNHRESERKSSRLSRNVNSHEIVVPSEPQGEEERPTTSSDTIIPDSTPSQSETEEEEDEEEEGREQERVPLQTPSNGSSTETELPEESKTKDPERPEDHQKSEALEQPEESEEIKASKGPGQSEQPEEIEESKEPEQSEQPEEIKESGTPDTLEEPETTSPDQFYDEKDRAPLPTDSMVTVSLSGSVEYNGQTYDDQRLSQRSSIPVSEDGTKTEKRGSTATTTPDIQEVEPLPQEGPVRSSSVSSNISQTSNTDTDIVDWVELEKTEELESKADPDDESAALLLARLEQENNALATDPKSGISGETQSRRKTRPPSVHQLKKLVDEPTSSSVRFSQLPTPPMTELEFWAALVADYQLTAQKLPTLTSNKIRAGVPPPLRGVVWPSIAGARDTELHEEYERLCGETSPYEVMIGKDIGRSWPNVEMFKDPNGEGQQMLARVLKCFSLYDSKIGYCQGLGFVVGPLLMHMSEAEAFCVLVRLMDHYDLQSCFQPTLSGLHLRTYQFQTLLSRHLPTLYAHLEELKVEPVYVSQWFLSFFAVTCPLPMLLRIFDVLLLEGACETLMRVSLSLMQRNEEKLLACQEFEDVMQLLLSRSLWDAYSCNADDLVSDFVSLTSLVTRESLQSIEAGYKESPDTSQGVQFPQLQAVASRFLGRLWAGSSSNSTKSLVINTTPSRTPSNAAHRSPSKQSMASTLNSLESSASDTSTAATEVSSTESSKRKAKQQNKDKDLHSQIEDLLMALTDMQREQSALAKELQREREEREEDQKLAALMIGYIKEQPSDEELEELLSKATGRFSPRASKRLSSLQTKQQLREDVSGWKEKYELEAARCHNLGRSIDDHEKQNAQLKEELREARSRLQDSHGDKQRLERTVKEMRTASQSERPESTTTASDRGSSGLRELKLGKASTTPVVPTTANAGNLPKRTSSLGAPAGFSPEALKGDEEGGLLAELVTAKTSEAVARQELDEVKAKLETMKKMIARNGQTSSTPSPQPVEGNSNITVTPPTQTTSTAAPTSAPAAAVGFFTSWTRRSPSTSTTTMVDAK